MSLTGPRFQSAQGVEQMIRNGVAQLKTLPGVVEVSATCCVPLTGGYGLPFTIVERPVQGPGPYHGGGGWMTVSPRYFEVFKIPVKHGRTFEERDEATSPRVVIINEAMARQYWGNDWRQKDVLSERLPSGAASCASSPPSRTARSSASSAIRATAGSTTSRGR
jgi:hypothetical protein